MAASEQLKQEPAGTTCSTAFATTPHSRVWTSQRVLDPRSYTGRSAAQVEDFVAKMIEPIRERYPQNGVLDPDRQSESDGAIPGPSNQTQSGSITIMSAKCRVDRRAAVRPER